MRFMVRPRMAGKTIAAVEWLREDPDNRVIITMNEREATRLRREYNLAGKQVVAYEHHVNLRHRFAGREVELAVDNLDLLLAHWFSPSPVRLVTATGEVA